MNLLIILGTLAACLYAASFLRTTQVAPVLESNPLPKPKNDALPKPTKGDGSPVELRVKHISVSGQYLKLEIINRTESALCSVKGHLIFTDKKGKPLYDSLQIRSFQPFSAYTPQGLIAPFSRKTITLDTLVPTGCKNARAELKQAHHADGTMKQFQLVSV